jgi:digeranylgeranylglycerophospholipid reductase
MRSQRIVKRRHYDVIIVGAGPVGGYLARKFREENFDVLILEEHDQIGRPFQCAGLVNPKSMERVDAYETVLTPIWGARMHSPSGISVLIGSPDEVRTWSVCRKLFDETVVKQSLEAGADILLSSRPLSAEVKHDGVELLVSVKGEELPFACKLLCGADGAHSWVRRTFKLGRIKEMMIGFQIEVTGYPGIEGRLDMYTGEEVSPGFFAWAIPSGETTRIGTWTLPDRLGGRSCEDLLIRLQNHPLWKDRFADCREVGRFCGPIPAGMIQRPLAERIAVFGDAAGQCKPTTGGGIGKGFEAVDRLVPALADSIRMDDLSADRMYHLTRLLEPMRKEQARSKALRDVFLTESSDEELDEMFKIWARPDVTALIDELGDIENPIPLGLKMLKDIPEFRRLTAKAAKALIWG